MERAAGKPWCRSRTVWFNAGSAALLLLEAAAAHLGLLAPLIPAAYYPLVVALITIGNVWLRAITTSPLLMRSPAPEPTPAGD
jgi:hypothetical protein